MTCKNSLLELNYSSLIGRPVFATLKIKMNFLFFVIFEFESLIFTFNTVYVNLQCCWVTFATSVIVLLFSVTQNTCLCPSLLLHILPFSSVHTILSQWSLSQLPRGKRWSPVCHRVQLHCKTERLGSIHLHLQPIQKINLTQPHVSACL